MDLKNLKKCPKSDGSMTPKTGYMQGYYNTGWFNPKMRSRAAFILVNKQ